MEATMEYTGKPLPGMNGVPGTTPSQSEVFPGGNRSRSHIHSRACSPLQSRRASDVLGNGARVLTENGFKALTKEEKEEAKRIALEAGFSFEGYQVVRREFFSYRL